jgi:hypothetical protein
MSLRRWAGDDDQVVDQVRNLIGAFLGPTLEVLKNGGCFAGKQ